MKILHALFAMAILPLINGHVLARHLSHPVTPENIDRQPYAFKVKVTDAGERQEFEIAVGQQAGKCTPGRAAWGDLNVVQFDEKKITVPPLTMVKANGKISFAFQIPPKFLDRAQFTFSEASDDPFPSRGDYYVFDLKKFVPPPGQDAGKGRSTKPALPKPIFGSGRGTL